MLLPGCLLLATGGSESWSAWSSALLLLSSGRPTTMSDTEMKLGSYWGGVVLLELKVLGEDVFVSGGRHAPALACRFKEMGEVPTSFPVLSSLISPWTLGEVPVVVAGHVAWD